MNSYRIRGINIYHKVLFVHSQSSIEGKRGIITNMGSKIFLLQNRSERSFSIRGLSGTY